MSKNNIIVDSKKLQEKAKIRHVKDITKSKLNRLRIEFSKKFLSPDYQKNITETSIRSLQNELAPFFDTDEKKQVLQSHIDNFDHFLQTGDIKTPLNLKDEESQLFWGMALAYYAIHPEISENWAEKRHHSPKISKSTIWRRIEKSSYMQQELQKHAYIIESAQDNPDTKIVWGEHGYPNISYCFIPSENMIVDDMLWTLVCGLDAAETAVNHEIAHSKGTYGLETPKMEQLSKEQEKHMEDMDRLAQADNREEWLKVAKLAARKRVEYSYRYRFFDELENMYANRYSVNTGGDYAKAKLNELETIICVGERYLSPLSLEDARKEIEETPEKRIKHTKDLARNSFFANNGIISAQSKDEWHSLHLYPELLSGVDKDGVKMNGAECFDTIREICDKFEAKQAPLILRSINAKLYEERMKKLSRDRLVLADEFFDMFVAPHMEEIYKKAEKEAENALNNQQEETQILEGQMPSMPSMPPIMPPQQNKNGGKENKQQSDQNGEEGNEQQSSQNGGDEKEQQSGQSGEGNEQQSSQNGEGNEQQSGQSGEEGNEQQSGQNGGEGNEQQSGQNGEEGNEQQSSQNGEEGNEQESGQNGEGNEQQSGQNGGEEKEQQSGQNGEEGNEQDSGQSGGEGNEQQSGQNGEGNEQQSTQNGEGNEQQSSQNSEDENKQQSAQNGEGNKQQAYPDSSQFELGKETKEQKEYTKEEIKEMLEKAKATRELAKEAEETLDDSELSKLDRNQSQQRPKKNKGDNRGDNEEQTLEDYIPINDKPTLIDINDMRKEINYDSETKKLIEGNYDEYQKYVSQFRDEINKAKKLIGDIITQKKLDSIRRGKSRTKQTMTVLPIQGGSSIDLGRHIELEQKIRRGDPNIRKRDLERFKTNRKYSEDELIKQTEIAETNVVILIDGSGSMCGQPFASALAISCILYEAARSFKEVNIYAYMMGEPTPTLIARPKLSTKEIGENIDAVKRGQGGCCDMLIPAITRALNDVGEDMGKKPHAKSGFTHIFSVTDGGNNDYGAIDVNTCIKVLLEKNPQLTFDSFFIDGGWQNYTKPFIEELKARGNTQADYVEGVFGDKDLIGEKIVEMLKKRLRHSQTTKIMTNDVKRKLIDETLKSIDRIKSR